MFILHTYLYRLLPGYLSAIITDMLKKCLEIGCHHRRTMLEYPECQHARIFMVDPIKAWLDKVPDNPRVTKINMAVTAQHSGPHDFWYIDEETSKANDLPDWSTTMGSLLPTHPTIEHFQWRQHQRHVTVPCVTLLDLIDEHDLWDIDFMQVDTEGMDHEILMALPEQVNPDIIRFESKLLSTDNIIELTNRFRGRGYQSTPGRERDWRGVNYDTILHKVPVPTGLQ